MQTLGHLLNFSVTNYSITLNGLICKGSFFTQGGKDRKATSRTTGQTPGGGREGDRQPGAPSVTLQLHKPFWQR